jgi:hypothetical protein
MPTLTPFHIAFSVDGLEKAVGGNASSRLSPILWLAATLSALPGMDDLPALCVSRRLHID